MKIRALALAVVVALPVGVAAQEPAAPQQPTRTSAPDEPLDKNSEAEQAAPPPRGPKFVWKQHPSLRFGKVLRLDFQAKFQEDYQNSYPGAADLREWDLHRSRIGVQGTLFKKIDFEVERELTEQELTERDVLLGLTREPQWKDVYVNVAYIDNFQVQAGKFKIPFGLDTLTGVSQNDFVYRALGSIQLTPARDVGIMAHGRFFKRGLSYWGGVFKHDGDNARSKKIQGGDETFAARVSGTPFRRLSPDRFGLIELGSSFAVGRVSDDSFRPNGLRGRTAVTRDTFYESVYVKGTRMRWAADVDWSIGPGSLRAEYIHVLDDRQNQGFGDETLPDARHQSWFVSGTWLLTGEKKTRPVKPRGDLFGGGFGAVELAARVERVWFDSVQKEDEAFANPRAFNILTSGEKVVTLGVNWSVNRFVKILANVIREQVEDPARSPVANGASFWSRVVRFQLVL